MKRSLLVIGVLTFAFAIYACGVEPNLPSSEAPGPVSVEDQASLLAALQAAGVNTEMGDPITQPFFSVPGQGIKINGMDLQIFEYENAEAMEKEASQVAPDGGSIGTSMVSWMDKPHFYKTGKIIVLYVGSDQAVIDLLSKVLGPQFAGQ